MISKTANPVHFKKLTAPKYNPPSHTETLDTPSDSFSFSRGDNSGWKIAGMTVALFSVPMAIATKSPALALVGGAVGIGLAFGSDA